MAMDELIARLRSWPEATFGEGASTDEISRAEHSLGVSIRGDYRKFLEAISWCSVEHIEVFGIGSGVPEHCDVLKVADWERNEAETALRPELLPVLNNGGGDLYCLDTSVVGEPPVVFWSHEDDDTQTPELEAVSFGDWLSERLDALSSD